MMTTYKPNYSNQGFTLIELLIATTLLVIIVALIIDEFSSQQGQSITQQQAVEIQQTARASMYLMSRRIRTVGYDPGGRKDAGIIVAGNGSVGNPLNFSYYVDFGEDGLDNDTDGSTDEVDENGKGFTMKTLSYVLNDSNADGDTDIVITDGGAPQLLAENVSVLNFSYLDKTNSVFIPTAATLEDIRAIQIMLTATTDLNERDQSKGNNLRTLTTLVKCRNLGL